MTTSDTLTTRTEPATPVTPATTAAPSAPPAELRQLAVERLEKRAEFRNHLSAYVLVNGGLALIWFLVADGGFFWPIFPILGWGIGVFFHAMDTYRRPFTEDRITREIERLTR